MSKINENVSEKTILVKGLAAVESGFAGAVFEGYLFEDCRFEGATFSACTFKRCTFVRCSFEDAALDDCKLAACVFRETSFKNADLSNCDLAWASFGECDFTEATLAKSNFAKASLCRCKVPAALLSELTAAGDVWCGLSELKQLPDPSRRTRTDRALMQARNSMHPCRSFRKEHLSVMRKLGGGDAPSVFLFLHCSGAVQKHLKFSCFFGIIN